MYVTSKLILGVKTPTFNKNKVKYLTVPEMCCWQEFLLSTKILKSIFRNHLHLNNRSIHTNIKLIHKLSLQDHTPLNTIKKPEIFFPVTTGKTFEVSKKKIKNK